MATAIAPEKGRKSLKDKKRDLYREAVQRGFDLSAAGTAGLGLGLAFAVGVAGAAILRALGRTDALVAATASWSPRMAALTILR